MQLLVRVVSKTSKDPVKDAQLTKAGDVICFKPDGEEWGIQELKNPDWRIIQVPGMTEEEAIALTSPELPPTLDKQYPLLRRRAMRLDLDQLDALAAGKILAARDEQKVDPKIPTDGKAATVAKESILAAASLKPALEDVKLDETATPKELRS